MGSPLSPVLADIYMEFFETMAIEKADQKATFWCCYVDDTFVVWSHERSSRKFSPTPQRTKINYPVHNGDGNRWHLAVLGCLGAQERAEADNNCAEEAHPHGPLTELQVQPPSKGQNRHIQVPGTEGPNRKPSEHPTNNKCLSPTNILQTWSEDA